MKAKKLFTMMMAAMMVAAIPYSAVKAEETMDTTVVESKAPKANVSANVNGMTINGRAATPKEKAVAKQMAKHGARMAATGVKMAAKAVTDPDAADRMANEMEALGQEMERLGDSLESLSEDTTFLYEGDEECADSVAWTDEDMEEILHDFKWKWSWPFIGFGGGILGILAGIFGILIAIFVVVLLFLLFTSPIWVLALIIWLAVRSNRKNTTTTYQNPPINPVASTTAQAAAGTEATSDAQATGTQTGTATASPQQPRPASYANGYVQPYPDENTEMWKSGIMYSCVGVGLIILFISIGAEDLWGVGALVGCIGVAKLVIASTTKGKKQPTASAPQSESFSTGLGDSTANNVQPTDYNKSEN